jgi:hypothetical protein
MTPADASIWLRHRVIRARALSRFAKERIADADKRLAA